MRINLSLILLLLLIGCSDQKIIEDMGFVRTITHDAIEGVDPKEKIKIAFSVPLAQVKDKLVFTTEARTSKQARVLFSRQNDRTIVSGQLRQVLFGKELARHGIWDYVDAMLRDPSIGRRVYIAMVDGDAEEILSKTFKQDPSTGEYLHDLLERAVVLTDIPRSNLHTFNRDYYDHFADPVVPILKIDKNYLVLKGLAFFRDDRYITEIDQKKNMIFSSLSDNLHTGELSINISEQEGGQEEAIILGYIESKRKVKVNVRDENTNGEHIYVDIKIKMMGSLLDYTGELNLSIPKNQKQLEKTIEEQLKKEANAIIKHTQEHKVDPIGIGQYVRNNLPFKRVKDLDWHEVYPNIHINVDYDVKIKEYGKMQ